MAVSKAGDICAMPVAAPSHDAVDLARLAVAKDVETALLDARGPSSWGGASKRRHVTALTWPLPRLHAFPQQPRHAPGAPDDPFESPQLPSTGRLGRRRRRQRRARPDPEGAG